ncbi:PEP-CTERM sorting domain-containing protein [Luteolibacter sp. SL250]|uniref:PEP-CTERM sorting domain-containing protein n=1 Tax=Luteolibacter sp. SL250 TaxID=2995170 RepID=UPI00226FBE18|nr:PEP-CTERM sorting domain-containing protein [Luteolibacter sp. SL250]WAC18840.1 PEP-CTERM sorting domain-containing protein [Luteolibacter sp. SL250]
MKIPRFLLIPFALGATAGLSSAAIMLDFGPTAVTDGATELNSPYHTANPSFTGSEWNGITADSTADLIDSSGTTLNGVRANLGANSTTGTTVALTANPSGLGLTGTALTSGIYSGTSVGRDGIFNGSGAGNARFVGFQITGLAAGTYDIYVASRNTNNNENYVQRVYAGAGVAGANFDVTGAAYSSGVITYANTSGYATSAWVAGQNYTVVRVDLTEGQALNVGVTGGTVPDGGSGELRGFLNSAQIVAVPEPTAAALSALGVLAFGLRRRR